MASSKKTPKKTNKCSTAGLYRGMVPLYCTHFRAVAQYRFNCLVNYMLMKQLGVRGEKCWSIMNNLGGCQLLHHDVHISREDLAEMYRKSSSPVATGRIIED